ncbi:uroporphyrinogen-III synthase [Glaciihabitans arcticus]|uniref:Uroporphyrinogen-III synthase n=1 Tax=Glaciihabitans arcticus TaxID=2668039 RepID=A0A4Q9GX79_9MICO|nr:uroporphyrinogen-III synthase [Glaciihabitans arcticus]TBN58208.1 uroporphyrinogen-III synthase [Glaciihabitans arcticus]
MSSTAKPLSGWRVLVPRGGKWGDAVSATLRGYGAIPVIAPLINFASAADPEALADSLRRLESGSFDWLVITSATTVDVLVSSGTSIPNDTKIAAVGETTAAALQLAGYHVDFVPERDNSARGLVKEWPEADVTGSVLIPHSDLAEPTIVAGLAERGFQVEYVAAYRTVTVPVADHVATDVTSGRINAVLVTSGSVARSLAAQLAPLPDSTIVACIGPRTAFDARDAGLTVHLIAETRSSEALVEALVEHAAHGVAATE